MAETRNVGPGSGGIGSATVSMSGVGSPNEGGAVNFSMPSFINANSAIQREYKSLSSGENVISVPDAAFGLFILPSAANAVRLFVRMAGSADANALAQGLEIGPTVGAFLSFPAGSTRTFEIWTSAAVYVTLMFF